MRRRLLAGSHGRAVLRAVVVQNHRGEQVHGLPVLVRRDRDRFRCGQPKLRQRWPPTASLYEIAIHLPIIYLVYPDMHLSALFSPV